MQSSIQVISFLKTYQQTFNIFELKKPKGNDYVVDWKLKGLFESKLPLHGAFLPYKIFWIQNKNTIQ